MPIRNVIFRAPERRPEDQDVHFHRGPQGQPTPCYEATCQIPRMSSEDISATAQS